MSMSSSLSTSSAEMVCAEGSLGLGASTSSGGAAINPVQQSKHIANTEEYQRSGNNKKCDATKSAFLGKSNFGIGDVGD
jgi:hypothetical protein